MSRTVIAFPGRKPTAEELVLQVRELASAGAIDLSHPHCRQRMAERDISQRQVLTTLQFGEAQGRVTRDQYGDWRVKLMAIAAGRKVQVVVAVSVDAVTVVTVF